MAETSSQSVVQNRLINRSTKSQISCGNGKSRKRLKALLHPDMWIMYLLEEIKVHVLVILLYLCGTCVAELAELCIRTQLLKVETVCVWWRVFKSPSRVFSNGHFSVIQRMQLRGFQNWNAPRLLLMIACMSVRPNLCVYPRSVAVLCGCAYVHFNLYLWVYVYECVYRYSHLGSR